MRRRRAVLAAAAAGLALAWLAAMVVTGARPVQRQFVEFEAKGVLGLPPERVTRVTLVGGDRELVLHRTGSRGWSRPDGTDVDRETGDRLSTAVEMMQRSMPVRRLEPAELAGSDAARYGLDPPRIAVTLFAEDDDPVLRARFGDRNPDDFLQYMQIDGDQGIYLMSRFVGEEWRRAMEGAAQP